MAGVVPPLRAFNRPNKDFVVVIYHARLGRVNSARGRN
jgi:hypothetical protein